MANDIYPKEPWSFIIKHGRWVGDIQHFLRLWEKHQQRGKTQVSCLQVLLAVQPAISKNNGTVPRAGLKELVQIQELMNFPETLFLSAKPTKINEFISNSAKRLYDQSCRSYRDLTPEFKENFFYCLLDTSLLKSITIAEEKANVILSLLRLYDERIKTSKEINKTSEDKSFESFAILVRELCANQSPEQKQQATQAINKSKFLKEEQKNQLHEQIVPEVKSNSLGSILAGWIKKIFATLVACFKGVAPTAAEINPDKQHPQVDPEPSQPAVVSSPAESTRWEHKTPVPPSQRACENWRRPADPGPPYPGTLFSPDKQSKEIIKGVLHLRGPRR